MTFRPVAHPIVPGETPPLALSIDGTPVNARAGDTLLSVLLRARGHVRHAEFGTPVLRAGFCLMGACQDCWVGLEGGGRLRACTALVQDGMRIETGLSGHG